MPTFDDFPIGFRGKFCKRVTERDNELFADISGDLNPIHFRDDVGQEAGFGRKISNGFVTESRIAAALVETFGSDGLVVVALEKNTRFLKPVYMDDEITATVEVIGRINSMNALKIRAACFNQDREQVVATTMVVRLIPCKQGA
jgi:3-hydroxybutyryl-CoA dehydratase